MHSHNTTKNLKLSVPHYESSSSLQNSIHTITFPKEKRFNDLFKKEITNSYYNVPSLKSNIGIGIGIGSRSDFVHNNGKMSPSPNSYNISAFTDRSIKQKKGVIIGSKLNYKVNYILKNLFYYI
jgi:hypothetical protein